MALRRLKPMRGPPITPTAVALFKELQQLECSCSPKEQSPIGGGFYRECEGCRRIWRLWV
jgi:hypothetical protein